MYCGGGDVNDSRSEFSCHKAQESFKFRISAGQHTQGTCQVVDQVPSGVAAPLGTAVLADGPEVQQRVQCVLRASGVKSAVSCSKEPATPYICLRKEKK